MGGAGLCDSIWAVGKSPPSALLIPKCFSCLLGRTGVFARFCVTLSITCILGVQWTDTPVCPHKKALVVPVGTTNAGAFGLLRPAATSSMNRGGLKSFDSTILVLLYSLNLSYRPYGRYLYSVRFEIPHCVSG